MDAQEPWLAFMIPEEDIAKADEDMVIDWYFDYSFYIMKRTEYWKRIFTWHVLERYKVPSLISSPRIGPFLSKINKPPGG